MAPSLSDLYPLVSLPRITDLDLCHQVVIPTITSTNTTHIDIGISKSIISSYILKPTPKLVWSFPLSPSTIVECMDVQETDGNSTDFVKTYVVGTTERKNYKALIIKRHNDTADHFEIKLDSKVKGVKLSKCGKFVYAILVNGGLKLLKINDDNLEDVSLDLQLKSGNELVYYKFISNHDFKYDNDLLLTIESNERSLVYKLTSLNYEKSFEINQFSHFAECQSIFTYQSGILYEFNIDKLEISSRSIIDFKVLKSIKVDSIIDAPTKSINDYSIICPSDERLLLSWKSKLYLINFKFQSLLDTYTRLDKIYIKQVVDVKGSSTNTSSTFAIYLHYNARKKNTSLNIINVNTGINSLSECLGKSIVKRKNDSEFKGLTNVIDDSFDKESTKVSKELKEIYDELVELKEKKNINKWELIVVPYLKNKSWSSIKKTLAKGTPAEEFSVFEVENDRVIDPHFISKVLSLIFDEQLDFIPEYTLIYLLTHPLFTYEHTKGLLSLFTQLDKPRLLRQAIITCPNLSIEEISLQLNNDNLEIFQDVITRLTNEFSVNQITHQLNDILQSKQNNLNLETILNNLIKLNNNQSWYLIQSIIDVGGLFNWSMNTVNNLIEIIEDKLASIMANNYNLTLTNQAILINEPIRKLNKNKKSGKKTTEKSTNIIELNNEIQQQQLNSILSIQNNAGKKLKDDGIEISKRIPNYSIEKLIL
ncbi:uncharacterized protein AC631_03646 [Debaryomyces fabryi]|uniref:U3 small nucleolar RNA-associated protein 8 n=1 Tax=Debaryomyces fabryi TaxID=58627 RepID=A0A0V1PWD9_9ASCO|nr:uncharacterized protein AC631_03646 [Debaryomyces fabryi]KSA00601.1 hypothetical protein AC631_03646 [Debaryomyces fabryi]CUM56213.1 unnamed protein product [Debaryomyces fabryi]